MTKHEHRANHVILVRGVGADCHRCSWSRFLHARDGERCSRGRCWILYCHDGGDHRDRQNRVSNWRSHRVSFHHPGFRSTLLLCYSVSNRVLMDDSKTGSRIKKSSREIYLQYRAVSNPVGRSRLLFRYVRWEQIITPKLLRSTNFISELPCCATDTIRIDVTTTLVSSHIIPEINI